MATCSVDQCNNTTLARGWCNKRTFGKAYEFMREKESEELEKDKNVVIKSLPDKIDQASLQRAIDNPPPNTKME